MKKNFLTIKKTIVVFTLLIILVLLGGFYAALAKFDKVVIGQSYMSQMPFPPMPFVVLDPAFGLRPIR